MNAAKSNKKWIHTNELHAIFILRFLSLSKIDIFIVVSLEPVENNEQLGELHVKCVAFK